METIFKHTHIPDMLRVLWLGIKLAIVIFAIFHATNVSILYQGF